MKSIEYLHQSVILIAFALMACGGSLSEDQRKKIKKDMKDHKIVKISDAEITEAAFAKGRKIIKAIDKSNPNHLDSLSRLMNAKINWVVPGKSSAEEIENQLIEAYLTASGNGGIEDNVQRLGNDTLLYTKLVTAKLPDGSEDVKGMWSIRLSKKQIILSLDK